jgi:mono/diheme cytochrome c family protein
MRTVRLLVVLLAALAALGLLFVYSGIYDVAAGTPDSGPIHWVLATTRERSVHRAAEALEGKVQVPDLSDPRRIRAGLAQYQELCATCHGAPGVRISEIGQGLNPEPPELTRSGDDSPEELFWIVKNGIKMTGMPAFGVTRDDPEIWAVVAFLKKMPELSPAEYQELVRSVPGSTP